MREFTGIDISKKHLIFILSKMGKAHMFVLTKMSKTIKGLLT